MLHCVTPCVSNYVFQLEIVLHYLTLCYTSCLYLGIICYTMLHFLSIYLGIMLHYATPALSHLYFVDPQWLCDMLAHIVTVPEVNRFIPRHDSRF